MQQDGKGGHHVAVLNLHFKIRLSCCIIFSDVSENRISKKKKHDKIIVVIDSNNDHDASNTHCNVNGGTSLIS